MIKSPLTTTGFLFVAALALSGCEQKERPAMGRVEGLPVAQESPAPAAAPAQNHEHQARPLSEIAGARGNAPHADTATTGAEETVIQAGETTVMAGGNILQAAGLAFTVADDWKNIKPSSAMRIAQYELAGSGGPAEMAVFYFGRGQGGGIEDNVNRWAGQFTPDVETSGTAGYQVGRIEKDSLRIALVKTEGTYDPGSMGPMGPASTGPKPNYALFGLVVEGGPEGSLFVKVTGPKATITEQNENLEQFAQSVRVSKFQ